MDDGQLHSKSATTWHHMNWAGGLSNGMPPASFLSAVAALRAQVEDKAGLHHDVPWRCSGIRIRPPEQALVSDAV